MFGKVFEFIAERFFDREDTQPKVGVSIQREGKTARLVLTNETQDAACDLKLSWPEGRAQFTPLLPYDLTGFQTKAVPLGPESSLPSDLTLVLVYRDLKGRFYCTRYRRERDQESFEFSPYTPPKTSRAL